MSSSTANILKEYKPAILFLLRFLGIYVIGNIIYGLWIASYIAVDPITNLISDNTVWLLDLFGSNVSSSLVSSRPTTVIKMGTTNILEIYEGCNAINVSILFLAFLFAYKGTIKRTLVYSLVGLFTIYVFNLFRLAGLFYVAAYFPDQMYLMHKFVFTGVIYAFIFFLWFLWVKKYASN